MRNEIRQYKKIYPVGNDTDRQIIINNYYDGIKKKIIQRKIEYEGCLHDKSLSNSKSEAIILKANINIINNLLDKDEDEISIDDLNDMLRIILYRVNTDREEKILNIIYPAIILVLGIIIGLMIA